jgi:glycosyltransferase involved in cell wall biosynthesis
MLSTDRSGGRSRPGLVVVSNEQTPYRMHFHRRLAVEIPELQLWSLFTHELASSPWAYEDASEIHPVLFGRGESSKRQSRLIAAPREWRKGGEILRWMERRPVAAVVVGGYNDAGRLRILRGCAQRRIPCFIFGDSNIACDQARSPAAKIKALALPPILASSAGILCCGSLGRAYFEKYGVPAERIFEVPYEPDYESIRTVPARAVEETKARFGLAPGRRRILFSCRLERVKRVDLLLEAFRRLASARPSWDLVIAGDGSLRETLAATVPPLLRERVHWAGFVAERMELAALYACSDVLVLPSDYEPWGVVVTEAAVWNAIVASSVVGAAAEVVRDGVNGRIFPAGDAGALTAALRDVTEQGRIDSLKAASPRVLAEWRACADPVEGLRRALAFAGVLPDGRG